MSELRDCVLVVDDDLLIADLWRLIVEEMGLHLCGTATTADLAITLAQLHRPRVVLMDVRLGNAGDGIDAAMTIRRMVGSNIIFITGSGEKSTVKRIEQARPTAVLIKPVSDRQLQAAVRGAMARDGMGHDGMSNDGMSNGGMSNGGTGRSVRRR